MRYVLAVSGGVDSVTLLDMMVHRAEDEIIVAHFDHGIRDDSAADARFVQALASKYDLKFETKREELGSNVSEETARVRRYEFLEAVAKNYDAQIVTAHHKDDVVETIAINLHRGTGWRGLAVFGNEKLLRPLVDMTKAEIHSYALAHELEWVEDSTNQDTSYLRNKLRAKLRTALDASTRDAIVTLWQQQNALRDQIDAESESILAEHIQSSRYFFTHIDEDSALELLATLLARLNLSVTRPQRRRLLYAIKTAAAGSAFEAGAGVRVTFTTREFIVKNTL